MRFVVQHQCARRCPDHTENDGWYTKWSYSDPWRAYLKLRDNRIFNYSSKYRMKVER